MWDFLSNMNIAIVATTAIPAYANHTLYRRSCTTKNLLFDVVVTIAVSYVSYVGKVKSTTFDLSADTVTAPSSVTISWNYRNGMIRFSWNNYNVYCFSVILKYHSLYANYILSSGNRIIFIWEGRPVSSVKDFNHMHHLMIELSLENAYVFSRFLISWNPLRT